MKHSCFQSPIYIFTRYFFKFPNICCKKRLIEKKWKLGGVKYQIDDTVYQPFPNCSTNSFESNPGLIFYKDPISTSNLQNFAILKYAIPPIDLSLKNGVCKIKLDELDFLSISNLNLAGYTGRKNQVQNRQKIRFIQHDFSNSVFSKINRGIVNLKPPNE